MIITLRDAAEYWAGKKSVTVRKILSSMDSIFTFDKERANRIKRFLTIVREYHYGVPLTKIMKDHGCSKGTIIRYAKMAGLPARGQNLKKMSREKRKALIALYKQGKPVAEIAAALGISSALVSRTATEEQINRHKFK